MSIDPIVPVHMAGQIFLDSSWQSTWMPVLAATIAGILTAITTFIIVSKGNKMTLEAIKNSNQKSLDEMKVSVESANSISLKSIEVNKEIEEKKISARAHQDWLKELTETLVAFCVHCENLGALTINKRSQLQHSDEAYQVLEEGVCPLLSDLSLCKHKLNCLLNMSEPEQNALYKKLHEVQNKMGAVVSDTVAKKDLGKKTFVDNEVREMINKLITDLRGELFVLAESPELKDAAGRESGEAA